ncbi:OmpA family protein [Solilutibacter oculi]|uniref:OmpA family protein n=1 Tax=Solilutibacter oculi TaxID=2698682 RepID=UPI001F1C2B89|nr:OmpA family protein [Lysobacter oculi]
MADTNGNTVTGDVGDTVTYSFSVTNTGTLALTNVVVSDPLLPGLSCTIANLAAGATAVCTATGNTHVIASTDPNPLVNTASADADNVGTIDVTPATDTVSTPVATTPTASLTLDKTASVADTNGNTVTGDVGDTVTYSFSVTNTGTLALTNVVVSDPLLPGLSCTIANLAAGATAVCTATGNTHVIASTDPNPLVNTASADADNVGTIDVTPATDTVSTPVATTPTASLTLDKTASVADTNGNTVTGDVGDTVTYSFSVTNTGTLALTNVVVSDPLLPGLSCTIANLAAGATAVCTATGNTHVIASTDPNPLVNTASADADNVGTIDVTPATDTVSTPVATTPTASLTLDKTASVADTNGNTVTGDVGDTVTYSFSVTNTGTLALTNVVVSDPLLPGLSCTIANLAAGATAVCTATGNTHVIASTDPNPLVNTASADADNVGTIDVTPATDTVSTPVATTPTASLTLDKTASVADTNGNTVTGDVGDTVTYSFSVTNTGTLALTNVVVSDPLLPGLSCTIANLAAGATAVCTATGNTHVIASTDPNPLVNTASADADNVGTIDVTPATDTVSTPVATTPTASLTLDKTASVADTNGNTVTGDVGDTVTYSFSVTNTGTLALTNVVVSDPLLPGLSCTIANLAAGATAVCTATGNTHVIASTDPNPLVNTASADADNVGTIDVTPATDTVSTPVATTPTASLTLDKTASVADTNGNTVTGDVGDTVTYSFSVTNTGTLALTNVVVSDPLLPGLSCTIANLAAGATAVCTATGNTHVIASTDPNPLVNTASADADNVGTIDVTPATDTVSTPVATTPTASLTLDKTASVADTNGNTVTGDVGDTVTYSFSVTNTGTLALTNVVVSDPLLPGLSCTIANLAAGATAVCTATGNTHVIASTDPNPLVNTASADADNVGTIDVTPATDTVSTPVATTPTASLTLDKTASVADTNGNTVTGDVGDTVTYSFSVTNTGTLALTNVVVSDPLLPGLSCTIANLAAGATAVCTATGNTHVIASTDPNPLVNTASADADNVGTIDVTPATDTVSTPVATTPTASLTLDKTASVADTNGNTVTGDVGDTVTYSFSVTNTGTLALTNVVVSDPLLPGLSCTIANLAAGATAVCTATGNTHVIASTDPNPLVNTASADADNVGTIDVTPATDTVSTPVATTPTASLTLDKTASVADTNGNTVTGDVGDTVTYSFSVTNTGTLALTNVVVSDPLLPGLSCTIANLAAGATAVCTATGNTHVIASTDPNPLVNTASADADNVGTIDVTPATDTVSTPVATTPTASLTLDKTASVADTNGNTVTGDVGDTVTYSFSVTNTGTLALTNVVVSDPLLPGLSCTIANLAAGATAVCTATGNTHVIASTDPNPLVNTASADADNVGTIDVTPATDTVSTPVLAAIYALNITKTVTSTGPYSLGSVIGYTVTATNTGNTTQANVVVTDSKLTPSTITCASVAPNGTCVLTGTYTVTQADVDAGKVDNTATVSSDTVTTPVTTPVVTTPVTQTPALTIAKTADKASFSTLGEVITYTYVITNTGNLTLAGPFTVNDDKIGALADCAAGPLVPGASARCTATYAITRADLDAGSVTNLASVTGNGVTSPQVSVTIVEQATPISVVDNDFGAIDGVTGGTTDSVLGNDTLGGQPVTVGTVALTPGTSPDPGLVMNPDGTITVAPNTPVGSYQYPYTLCERANPSNCGTAIATVVVEARTTSMRVTKTATPRDVEVGGLVRYTLLIENTGAYAVADASVIDTPPAGFSYVDGSMTVADADNAGRLVGTNPLAIDRIDIAVGGRATVTYMMRVGAGVRPGGYVNRAKMVDNGRDASNVASAEVQVKSDPMLDDSLIAGTVWDDRDGDGWQDSAAVTGLKVQGGFAPSAYVANSTTVDRGNGPQPEADASSPMLHGIALGSLAGRQSDADPASSHAIVIRQTLSSLAFTDDFVLGNDQGYTVRMNAAGQTSVERTGDAAKGLNGAELQVERTVAQVGNGYQVDYIVRSTGVDERGIPGVRIASVEGLVVETDQFGRYHIAGIAGGPQERGRNFILKVDPATLPPGSTMTTDNPLLRRVTPGLPVRFDFGVKLPESVIEGGRKDLELELGEVVFAPGKADVQPQYDAVVELMAAEVRRHGGGEVVIRADGESQALAYERALAVQGRLLAMLDPASAAALKVTLRTDAANPDTTLLTLGETPVLGTFLFDTNKAVIKPGFGPLLDRIARTIEGRAAAGGRTVIAVVGHADRRGSRDYNQALGLRRAKAVYEAIAARLGATAKARLRVDIDDNQASPTGLRDDGR